MKGREMDLKPHLRRRSIAYSHRELGSHVATVKERSGEKIPDEWGLIDLELNEVRALLEEIEREED